MSPMASSGSLFVFVPITTRTLPQILGEQHAELLELLGKSSAHEMDKVLCPKHPSLANPESLSWRCPLA
jgi:hypothetical protein